MPAVPRLIYHRTSEESLHALHSLIVSKQAIPSRTCVLLDKHSAIQSLEFMQEDLGVESHFICSAEIYDDTFSAVRHWVREGYAASDIQAELDRRFEEVSELAAEIAALNEDKADSKDESEGKKEKSDDTPGASD